MQSPIKSSIISSLTIPKEGIFKYPKFLYIPKMSHSSVAASTAALAALKKGTIFSGDGSGDSKARYIVYRQLLKEFCLDHRLWEKHGWLDKENRRGFHYLIKNMGVLNRLFGEHHLAFSLESEPEFVRPFAKFPLDRYGKYGRGIEIRVIDPDYQQAAEDLCERVAQRFYMKNYIVE